MKGCVGTRLFTAALLPLLLAARFAAAEPRQFPHVQAELVSETSSLQPGAPLWVAVRLNMDPDWHVYWKNPGDSGLPTTVAWKLPDGYFIGPLLWPAPKRFISSGIMTYGYDGETLLLARITPPALLATGSRVVFHAEVIWLVCRVECVPGKADLSLTLPVSASPPAPNPREANAFFQARAKLPRDISAAFSAAPGVREITLTVEGLPLSARADAYFFPESEDLIAFAAPQTVERKENGFRLRLLRADAGSPLPDALRGVLVVSSNGIENAQTVDVPLAAAQAPVVTTVPSPTAPSLLIAALFAFIGGLILNLMPCVLPVLSLKVMGFVREAQSSRGRAVRHGLFFTAGVLISFWALLGALLAFRAGGNLIGWGFQFQDPGMVVAMAILLFILGLNLFGVFEVGTRAASVGTRLRGGKGFVGSFFTGFLATVVATPCTAPFMGGALGYALTHSALSAFTVFTALGLGMAAPSLALSASPRLLAMVPKPGRWMETLKQALGFLMMATVVWLGWVLSALAGAQALTFLIGSLAVCGLGAWIYGRWGGIDRRRATRIAATAIAVLLVILGGVAAVREAESSMRISRAGRAGAEAAAGPADSAESPFFWEPYSPERLTSLRASGTPVFIDFTAQWCLTCKVNEKLALDNLAVKERFKALGVTAMRGDWTDGDVVISRALSGYGRSGVPLYVLYGSGAGEPVILPEILTPGIVLGALNKAAAAR
jgi:thiol:disulfide interchange protein DsbD